MKRMLLSVLLFAASVIMAQAQGFRVHRSDGAVYEFSVVADSIVFFDGEGDPNYQEPVPDYVLDAINQLQAYCDNLKATCAENRVFSQWNAEMIKELTCQLYDLKDEVTEVKVGCEANNERAKVYVDTEIANLKSSVLSNISSVLADIKNNSNEISKLEANLQKSLAQVNQTLADIKTQSLDNSNRISKLETALDNVEAEIEAFAKDTYARVATLEANVYNFKDHLMLLVERDAEKDAMIKALSERIAALEAKVNQ